MLIRPVFLIPLLLYIANPVFLHVHTVHILPVLHEFYSRLPREGYTHKLLREKDYPCPLGRHMIPDMAFVALCVPHILAHHDATVGEFCSRPRLFCESCEYRDIIIS